MDEKMKAYALRLPVNLFFRLRDEAKHKGVSMNSIVINALWSWFGRTE